MNFYLSWFVSFAALFSVLIFSLPNDISASANNLQIDSEGQTTKNRLSSGFLFQYKSGRHILGFQPDRVYMVGVGHSLIEEFVGAQRTTPVGTGRGSISERDIPQLGKVTYPNIWKGITISYDADDEGLAESTYTIEPGADVSRIRIQYNASTSIQRDGSLHLKHTDNGGYFILSSPIAWQEAGGTRKKVEVAFRDFGDNTIGFKVGEYDKRLPLIIDPTYQWHTFYGSSGRDDIYGIALDNDQNVYVTGFSEATWGAPLNAHSGGRDIVVLKLDKDGIRKWHTFYGSANADLGRAIAVDGSGYVYVTGFSMATWGAPLHAHSGGRDIVVLKLNSSGALQWHTFYGGAGGAMYGPGTEEGYGIALDSGGNILVSGYSYGSWNGPTDQSPIHAYSSLEDLFVLKLSSAGAYVWHTFYGTAGFDIGSGIAVSSTDDIYIGGYSAGTWQGDAGQNPLHAYTGGYDILVLKLNSAGAYQWHTFYGSGAADYVLSVALDGFDNIYLTGTCGGSWNGPANQAPLHAFGGTYAVFVLKLSSAGAYQWHTFYGAAGHNYGYSITVTDNFYVYVAGLSGATWNGDGNTAPLHAFTGAGGVYLTDLFVMKFDDSGSYQWHTFYPASDMGAGIKVVQQEAIYACFPSVLTWNGDGNIPPLNAYSGSFDITVMKMSIENKLFTRSKGGNGGGTVNANCWFAFGGDNCNVETGTVLNLTATPNTGSLFEGWSMGTGSAIVCNGTSGSCRFVITENSTLQGIFTPIPPPPCTYSISPSSQQFDYTGGFGSVNVIESGGCTPWTWSVSSNESWITMGLTSSSSVSFTVGQNDTAYSRTGTISIAGNTFTVRQEKQPGRLIAITQPIINFGTVPQGSQIGSQLSITNAGTNPFTITGIGITGTNASHFSYSTTCIGVLLAPGSSCLLSSRYIPTLTYPSPGDLKTSVTHTAELVIRSTDTAVPVYTVPLSASTSDTSVTPQISANPSSINLPYVDIEMGENKFITLTNTGTGTLVIDNIRIQGRNKADFSIRNTCTLIPEGRTCSFLLWANYTSQAEKRASVVITSNAVNMPKLEIPVTIGSRRCLSVGISATSITAPTSGMTGAIDITASADCWWRARSDSNWIALTNGGWTQGSNKATYTVEANTTGIVRYGHIIIGDHTFTIAQGARNDNVIFRDTTGLWAEDYINTLYAGWLTRGCNADSTLFCPKVVVTREIGAVFIIRFLEGDIENDYCRSGSPFTDVHRSGALCGYIKRLSERAITSGCNGDNILFCPSDALTRRVFAEWNIRGLFGENFSYPTTPYFQDVPATDEGFKYIQKLKELSLTKAEGMFYPNRELTREEMAVFGSRTYLGME